MTIGAQYGEVAIAVLATRLLEEIQTVTVPLTIEACMDIVTCLRNLYPQAFAALCDEEQTWILRSMDGYCACHEVPLVLESCQYCQVRSLVEEGGHS